MPSSLLIVILLLVKSWRLKVLRALLALFLPFVAGELMAGAPADRDALKAQSELVERLSEHFESLEPVEGTETRFAELRVDLQAIQAAMTEGELETKKLAAVEREIRSHSEGMEGYRQEYVRWVRLVAEGERYPELRLRHGMVYREVVIRRVTGVGLEVRHSSGTARLRHGDLSEEWQDRFLWTGEEAQRSLAEEARADRKMEILQRYAITQGRDPVVAREEELARLALAELESSDPIVPAKLEPSEPLELAELEPAELEPVISVGPPRPKTAEKSR